MVNSAAHVTETAFTRIDHVFTNNTNTFIEVYIPDYSLSDHNPVVYTWKCKISCSKNQGHKFRHYRSVKSFHEDNFSRGFIMSALGIYFQFKRSN